MVYEYIHANMGALKCQKITLGGSSSYGMVWYTIPYVCIYSHVYEPVIM